MAEEIKEEKKPDEDWMTKKWRPMMAMMYMTCCLFDFAVFPIMFTIVQFWEVQAANDAFRQWVPITLQGGGLFHVAMGAVLGVSAYGRTQEKVAGATGPTLPAGLPTPQINPPAPMVVTNVQGNVPLSQPSYHQAVVGTPVQAPVYQQAPQVTAQQYAPPVVAGFGGKLAPPPAEQPLI